MITINSNYKDADKDSKLRKIISQQFTNYILKLHKGCGVTILNRDECLGHVCVTNKEPTFENGVELGVKAGIVYIKSLLEFLYKEGL